MFNSLLRWFVAGAFAIACCPPLSAQNLLVMQPSPLRSDRTSEATTLRSLAVGEPVSLVQMSGGWIQVQAGAAKGWLRASQLDLEGAEVAASSRLETGRRANGASPVTLGVRSLPPRANRHALIIGVANYKPDASRPVTALAGVKHDMVSAIAMARLLQVPTENITLLRDEAATREGVQRAIADLQSRVQVGDRVFVYWSGHGSRYFDPLENDCVETVVPYDLQDISSRQFAQWIKPLAIKSDKMLVVYDACHSGGSKSDSDGPATRALQVGLAAKSIPSKESCQLASNVQSRGLGSAARSLSIDGQDLVHLSSSRFDEVSFDNADTGGLATSTLRECMQGDAADTDGSGAISVDELVACAQHKMEARLKGFPGISPQHLVVNGNRSFVPAWFAGDPMPQVTAPGLTSASSRPTSGSGAVLTSNSTPTPTPTSPNGAVQSVLEQIHAQRDSKRRVSVQLIADRLRIGADTLGLSVTSSVDGNLYIAMLGTDGKSLYLLFPNDLDPKNRIAAGETVLLPRPSWRVVAAGPKGQDTLLVMVTDTARDLSGLSGEKSGPFVKPLLDADGRTRLQWLLGQHASGGPTDCRKAGCSGSFGSALVKVEEY